MSKTTIVVIVITLIVVIAGAGTGYVLLKPASPSKTPYPTAMPLDRDEVSSSPSPKEASDTLYNDASGFSFKYPASLSASDTTPSDTSFYTQVTVAQGSEKLIFSVKDTKSKTTADWLKTKEAPTNARLSGELTMGGMAAQQYETDDKLYTIVIDGKILYLIESPKAADWETVQNKIVNTFAFVTENSATSTTTGSGSSQSSDTNTIYEEEVIQ